jgi:hypothetical protein
LASSGASASDELASVFTNYGHSSDDRNTLWNADVSFQMNTTTLQLVLEAVLLSYSIKKNTEISVKANTI